MNIQRFDYARAEYYSLSITDFYDYLFGSCYQYLQKIGINNATEYLQGWKTLLERGLSFKSLMIPQSESGQIYSQILFPKTPYELRMSFSVSILDSRFCLDNAQKVILSPRTEELGWIWTDSGIDFERIYKPQNPKPIYLCRLPLVIGKYRYILVDGNHRLAAMQKYGYTQEALLFDVRSTYASIMGEFERVFFAFLVDFDNFIKSENSSHYKNLLWTRPLYKFVQSDLVSKGV